MDALKLWWLQDQCEIFIITKNLYLSSNFDNSVGSIADSHPRGQGSMPGGGDVTTSKFQVSFLIIEEQLSMLKFFRHGYNTCTMY